MVGPDGSNRTATTLKLLVKNANVDRTAQVFQYLVERLGYTEERAKAVLQKYS
jgi:hypothetical protein